MNLKIDLSKIDVLEMLETLEMRNISDSEDEVQFSCPLSGHLHGDARPSAYMNKHTTAWLCHGCHAKGNAISFLSQVYDITPLEATRALRNEFDNEFKEPVTSMRNELEGFLKCSEYKEPPKPKYLDDMVLKRFPLDGRGKTYANIRGLSDEACKKWELGWDSYSDRLTIPVRDETNRLVGIKGRSTRDADPKYVVLGGDRHYHFPTYEVSQILFGINHYVKHKCEQMILCEGELNVIHLWQKGFKGAVAISGSNLSQAHIKDIKRHSKSIVLFFDSDSAGFDVTAQAVEALEPYMPVKLVPDHEGDPAEMPISKIRQCLNDAESSINLFLPEIDN